MLRPFRAKKLVQLFCVAPDMTSPPQNLLEQALFNYIKCAFEFSEGQNPEIFLTFFIDQTIKGETL